MAQTGRLTTEALFCSFVFVLAWPVFYSAFLGVWGIVINRLSVCLSVCEHISGTVGPIRTKFCVQITGGVTRSSSDGVALRYVLPYLWMTSLLAVMGTWPARVGSTQRRRRSITCATGAESDDDDEIAYFTVR